MKIYFLMYHVKPLPDVENAANIAGAYVSCWIEANSVKDAIKIAKEKIDLAKWNIIKKEEAYEITEQGYLNNSAGLAFYKQALIDKWVLRFHTYPIE